MALNQGKLVFWIRAVGGFVSEGDENCLKYLQRGWNRKEGRGNKDSKKVGGKLGHGVGALKGEAGPSI